MYTIILVHHRIYYMYNLNILSYEMFLNISYI